MPTYEYQCQKCGHRFDYFQSMTEPPLKKCPVCKGKVERLISAGGGLIFKGSGFYITDYARSDEYKKKVKEEKSSSSPKPADGDGKAKKPATTPPSSKAATPKK